MAQISSRDVKPRSSLKRFFLLLLWIIIPSAWCGLLCVSITTFFSTLTWRAPNGNQAAQLSVSTSFPTYRYIFLFLIVLLISSAAIVVGRWVWGNKERLQTVLLIFSYVFCGLSILFSIVLFSIRTYPWFFVALIVVAVAFAFARTKLFEASAFINRTLVYSILTISLALIYFGVIAALQLLDPKNVTKSEPDIVVSTLVAVVMFYPLRTRIQKIIDKRFYRSRYDAEKVIAAFNATLREEIDLDQLCDHLKEVVEETMHPASFSLWLIKTATDKIAPDDPLVDYALKALGAIDVQRLQLDSPALQHLRTNGVSLTIPLVAQGELVGLLNLGPHLSQQKYSQIDRSLLNTLATNVAPALRVAQMVQEQQAQVRERERLEQELRTARLIQHSLLPKEVPELPGWQIAPYYQPAWEVGGDFYDFLTFEDGHLGLVIGDVAGKGVPAALLMATTRSMLRAAAQKIASPGEVLAQVNELLLSDMPPNLFVTCFYALLDPTSGKLRYANAGQDLPYRRSCESVAELRARGMPLGLLPGMRYEEQEVILVSGDSVLFYSDGLVEAHNQRHEMFGFPHLMALVEQHPGGIALINYLLAELAAFTGSSWEQEDDLTLVVLHRTRATLQLDGEKCNGEGSISCPSTKEVKQTVKDNRQLLAEWTISSEPGNERQAIERIAEVVQPLQLPVERLDSLKTAVAEATMNAMEHGNHYQPDKVVTLQVLASATSVAVRICDQGEQGKQSGETLIPDAIIPDLEAKLAGMETPRGWGLFLIKNLVDELHVENDEHSHTVEVIMHRASSSVAEE